MSQLVFSPLPSGSQSFYGYIQEGKIFRMDHNGSVQLGVTNETQKKLQQEYDALCNKCDSFYNRLVELGDIKPEPTQQDLLKQQSAQMSEVSRMLKDSQITQVNLTRAIEELTHQLSARSSREYPAPRSEVLSRSQSAVEGQYNGGVQGVQTVSAQLVGAGGSDTSVSDLHGRSEAWSASVANGAGTQHFGSGQPRQLGADR